jgi:hypothetical protein
MHMRRFISVARIKKETVWTRSKYGWHWSGLSSLSMSNFVFDGFQPSSTYVQAFFRLWAVEHCRSLYSTPMGRQVLSGRRLFRPVGVELRELRPGQQAVEHLFVRVLDGA